MPVIAQAQITELDAVAWHWFMELEKMYRSPYC
jgi:hypothetical protein